jgi:hypothetical protein
MTCGTHDLWCSGDLVEVFAQVCILQTNSSCCTCVVAALVSFMLQRVFRASSDVLTCKSLCNHASICAPSSLWRLKHMHRVRSCAQATRMAVGIP